jgi:hypothetical protein
MLLVGATDASSGVTPDPTELTRSLKGDDAMFARADVSLASSRMMLADLPVTSSSHVEQARRNS